MPMPGHQRAIHFQNHRFLELDGTSGGHLVMTRPEKESIHTLMQLTVVL